METKCCANCVHYTEKASIRGNMCICTRNGKEKYLDKLKAYHSKCLFYKKDDRKSV